MKVTMNEEIKATPVTLTERGKALVQKYKYVTEREKKREKEKPKKW